MVLTSAQTEELFNRDTQMAIPNATVVQLQYKGISYMDNLIGFDKDSLGKSAKNLRLPGGGINPFAFGIK